MYNTFIIFKKSKVEFMKKIDTYSNFVFDKHYLTLEFKRQIQRLQLILH